MFLIEFQLLFLIIVVNGAPILGAVLLGRLGRQPIDNGYTLPDGRPLLGRSKTWRGLLAALSTGAATAWLLGLPPDLGLTVAAFAMLGDLFSSFIKRRLGLESSSMAFGLDQVPESLFPLLAVAPRVGLGWLAIVELVVAFVVIELLLSRILYHLRVRKQPY